MFEFGKTYKTRDGRDALVVVAFGMTKVGYLSAIVDEQEIHYTREGRYQLDNTDSPLDLMPPLEKIIGGIYKDNHGNRRVLVQGKTELHAMNVYDFTSYSALDDEDWTRGKDFILVELVFDANILRSNNKTMTIEEMTKHSKLL